MREETKEALDIIIKNKQIRTVFQPIVSLRDGYVLGHEALSRITGESKIENPEMLFNLAGEYNKLWDLELLCRTTALEAAFKFMVPPYNKKLFINVNPNTMHDDAFRKGFTKDFLRQYHISPKNIIFEITEKNVISDMAGFRATVDHYKSQDYEIAIDDAGAGYSGLNLISDISPSYIKLDMNLIRGINTDNLKFALVKGMVELSKVSNIQLIAEGIETYDELDTLVNLGVQYGQGFFIQKPHSMVQEIREAVLQDLKKLNKKKNHTSQSSSSKIYIANLCAPTRIISATEMTQDIYDVFKKNPSCFGVCVVENEMPVGIVTQEKLALKLSGHFGFVLYQNKPISEVMDRNFLSVDYKTPISIVSAMAMARSYDKLYDFIIITENEKCVGAVTIKSLLEKTTEIEISAAKHLNPLSGLPGNLLIEQNLSHCVSLCPNYSVAYLDIDNFKAYNDVYGFANGDLIIKLLADILCCGFCEEDFIGHVGGDDFVVMLEEHVTQEYFEGIVNKFEHEVLGFYDQTDIQNGFITAANRHGVVEQFPLITLTCVVINNQTQTFANGFEITELLAGMKKIAKERINVKPTFEQE
ncbi:GGDEF domain-containing protein [Acetobacterium bakii]|uniref:Diguanylate cyclase n=1 Tax=Acetobacterium bakii TaxID=52689 RepID=A0A0L6U003_9FIRM|nr:GGDEF domain-containing protein [Acetobacterium bakii]KNZ41828.1 diguanylate cyclase [Acetobacterium bakii]